MVETYGISMIEQLKEHPESHNVCADIGMCYRDQTAGFVNMQEFSSKNLKFSLISFMPNLQPLPLVNV